MFFCTLDSVMFGGAKNVWCEYWGRLQGLILTGAKMKMDVRELVA